MDHSDILKQTSRIIAEKADLDIESISSDTALADLDMQSLDLAEVIFDLEEAFNIEIELDTVSAWEKLKTVADVVEVVSGLVSRDA